MRILNKWFVFTIGLLLCLNIYAKEYVLPGSADVARLPREVQATLIRIKQGGPFPYARDGAVFGNHEGVLPRQKRGYYREYTVETPGVRNRGARRVIAGGGRKSAQEAQEYFYTDNHYITFRRIIE